MDANQLKPAEEVAVLIRTKCLTDRGFEQAKRTLSLTAKDSPHLAEIQTAADAAQSRWDSEATVREARAALETKGYQWDRETDMCRKKVGGGKPARKLSLVAAIREAGLGS